MATWSLFAVGRVGTGPVPGVPPPPEKAVPWREHAYSLDEVKDK
ncbi:MULTISPECIES: hypothetical protein [Streptomyces]|nr:MULTISPECIES: hypothetical protein [Streptomyces]WCL87346.1 hypothetical protein PPN52_23590 [Streptomyces sp. JCM 35825]